MTLTKEEIQAIEREAEEKFPDSPNFLGQMIIEGYRTSYITAATAYAERAKDEAVKLLDLFKVFMPKEVDITNRKHMAMYEVYHRINRIIEPSKYPTNADTKTT